MSRTKIFIFTSPTPWAYGGVQTCNRMLAAYLLRQNYEAFWIYPNRANVVTNSFSLSENELTELQLIPLNSFSRIGVLRKLPTVGAIMRWRELLLRENPTAILLNLPSDYGMILFFTMPRVFRKRTTIYLHGHIDLGVTAIKSLPPKLQLSYYLSEMTRWKLRMVYKRLISSSGRTLVVSERVVNSLVRNGVLGAHEHLPIVPPPTALCHDCGPILKEQRSQIRRGKDFVVLTVCRLDPLKGINALIPLAERTEESLKNFNLVKQVQFLIVGKAVSQSYLRRLKKQISNVNNRMQRCSIELVGAVNGADLCKYLQSADAFILPSLTEAFGLVNIEAAAHELPVITWGEADTRSTIQEIQELGFSIPILSYRDVYANLNLGADFICRLVEDSYFKSRIGRKAKELVRERYDPAKLTSRILNFLDAKYE